ncbi:MAG: UvrD-helicase domain-containing protein [Clostridia bacterium]|nr:UvrD-helicase domain-containing protein [Clostridia bacterium]
METYLSNLNPEQIKPVTDTEGAVLVLAGAGSGKTRVLTSRIAYLVREKGIDPADILAITFTNKAANEMKERLSQMVDCERMWICTIHSMCVRILRMFPEKLGYNKNFSIYAESESATVLKKTFRACGLEDEKLLKKIRFSISEAKNDALSPEDYALKHKGEDNVDIVEKVYALYQKHLKENNAFDFDDLLVETLKLLKTDRETLDFLAGKFRYILVDEFQDTNGVQFEIAKYLASEHGNLFVVGDDDQSIYGWRGAKIENILNFHKSFRGAKVYKLEQNYRSTKVILSLANTVIQNNGKRNQKTLWTDNSDGEKPVYYAANEEADEALYAARTISKLVANGYRFSDFAVLMRVNALTRSYEQEFAKYGINFKVFGGFKFFERKEIKDVLAYFRIVSNPLDNEAVARIINFPKRGIGDKTVQALEEYASREGISVYDALFELDEIGFNSGTRAKLTAFCDLLKDLVMQGQVLPVNELVRYILAATKMREAYDKTTDEGENKLANIDEFVNAVDEFVRLNPTATVADYLSQVTLSTEGDDVDETDFVTLATIHAVKGLEFRQVFLCGLEEGIFPGERSKRDADGMEEERRLMYVAITRAKEKIYFTRSKSRFMYGKREMTIPSCFLKELEPVMEIGESLSYNQRRDYGQREYGGTYGLGRMRVSSYQKEDEGYMTFGSATTPRCVPLSVVTASKPTAKDLSSFRAGVKVKHPKFGVGTIVATKGEGQNLIVNVAFEGQGIKQLSAALAPLELI